VRVIDGTGAPAPADQTIVISGGKIKAIGKAEAVAVPSDANRMDFTGYSALPGLVGMHDHLFYPGRREFVLWGVGLNFTPALILHKLLILRYAKLTQEAKKTILFSLFTLLKVSRALTTLACS
jgi:imidazolonepropionase-like amidohydrolase